MRYVQELSCALAGASVAFTGLAVAQSIDDYVLSRTFDLPPSFNGTGDFDDTVRFDDLPDGRLIVLNGGIVSVETGVGTGQFTELGTIPGFQPTFGPTFIQVSPDGTRAAVGSNGEGSVVVFDTADPTAAESFSASDFDAVWIDNDRLAISNSNGVDVLDTTTGQVTNAVTNIGGASAGITFDSAGNLYTGNGFDFAPGGSDTGTIKVFDAAAFASAISGGPAIDFENDGVEVADLLSANSLGFDAFGNFFVGGGDLFGGSGDVGYAGLIDAAAIAARLDDPAVVPLIDVSASGDILRMFDTPQEFINLFQPPSWSFNDATGELYLRYFEQPEVLVFVVPSPGAGLVVAACGLASVRRRRAS
ncbi:MAG: hypothetical protein AAGI30_02310 [Planctomycetota bacterium]